MLEPISCFCCAWVSVVSDSSLGRGGSRLVPEGVCGGDGAHVCTYSHMHSCCSGGQVAGWEEAEAVEPELGTVLPEAVLSDSGSLLWLTLPSRLKCKLSA